VLGGFSSELLIINKPAIANHGFWAVVGTSRDPEYVKRGTNEQRPCLNDFFCQVNADLFVSLDSDLRGGDHHIRPAIRTPPSAIPYPIRCHNPLWRTLLLQALWCPAGSSRNWGWSGQSSLVKPPVGQAHHGRTPPGAVQKRIRTGSQLVITSCARHGAGSLEDLGRSSPFRQAHQPPNHPSGE